MKNLVIILFLLIGLSAKAQLQELIENTWYLEKLVIEGEELFAPNNEEVNNVIFRYVDGNYTFSTTVCAELILGFELLNDNSFWGTSIMHNNELCIEGDNHYFENLYFDFFWNSGIFEESFYEYQINQEGENLKLIISAGPATEAHYSTPSLSTTEVLSTSNFQIAFQNDDLIIKSAESIAKSVSIFDWNGKLILASEIKNGKVNAHKLPKGIYIVTIIDQKGKSISKKVRKD